MDRLRLCSHLPEILGRKTNYSGSGRPLNGPPTTLLRVFGLSFVLKLAAMYDCEPEYNINSFVCIHCNKKCLSVVTVRLLNKLNIKTKEIQFCAIIELYLVAKKKLQQIGSLLLLGSYYTYWSYYMYCSNFWWIVLFIFIKALLFLLYVLF